MQLDLGLSVPPVPVDSTPPVRGTTAKAKRASQSGARCVVKTWTERQSIVLQLLDNKSMCRQELVALTGYPVNSICSVIGALLKLQQIERTGQFDVQRWENGTVTLRETFSIRRTA